MTKKAAIVNLAVPHASGNRASSFIPPQKIIHKILTSVGVTRGFVTVVFTNDAAMKKINRAFLKRNRPTDVLAFDYAPQSSRDFIAGEAYVSIDMARRISEELGISFKEELMRYVVHAILHLIGYDDLTPAKKKKMWKKQEEIVRKVTRHRGN
jgi:probable rRNA maturation factor